MGLLEVSPLLASVVFKKGDPGKYKLQGYVFHLQVGEKKTYNFFGIYCVYPTVTYSRGHIFYRFGNLAVVKTNRKDGNIPSVDLLVLPFGSSIFLISSIKFGLFTCSDNGKNIFCFTPTPKSYQLSYLRQNQTIQFG